MRICPSACRDRPEPTLFSLGADAHVSWPRDHVTGTGSWGLRQRKAEPTLAFLLSFPPSSPSGVNSSLSRTCPAAPSPWPSAMQTCRSRWGAGRGPRDGAAPVRGWAEPGGGRVGGRGLQQPGCPGASLAPGCRDLAACLREGALPTREGPHCPCDRRPVSRSVCVASRPPTRAPVSRALVPGGAERGRRGCTGRGMRG